MNFQPMQKEEIEMASRLLLLGHYRKFGPAGFLPIPVEEILESHLGLTLEFDDLRQRLGMNDVLGATWVNDRRVVVDISLDPTVDPRQEGRYRFTLAHELGHWELHRHDFENGVAQRGAFRQKIPPSIVCRTSTSKDPMEWQADLFASYLLMPTKMLFDVWSSIFDTSDAYDAANEMAELISRWDGQSGSGRPVVSVAREMARAFHVSGQAMQIRLQHVGLIRLTAN
ncbi:MAG: ImmA/IrrE family metallo-endopeptidase [Magnetococcales bacterium]|nr:ImmA/IrrE family metallo-endopeptidase [Magnetococcales bacterium]